MSSTAYPTAARHGAHVVDRLPLGTGIILKTVAAEPALQRSRHWLA